MSDYNETKVNDTYKDHAQHFTYREDCSTCYSNVKKFDDDDYDYDKDDANYHENKDNQ